MPHSKPRLAASFVPAPSRRTKIGATIAGVVALALASLALAQQSGAPLATRALGEAADDYPEGQYCASGIAINALFSSVCTIRCTTDADCGRADWGCKALEGLEGGSGVPDHLCFPRRVVPAPAP